MRAVWFTVVVAAGLLPSGVNAHSWYPHECCGSDTTSMGGDCKPVPCESLRDVGNDVIYTDPKNGMFTFKDKAIRNSIDDKCHVCIQWGVVPRCVFQKHPGTS